MKLKLVDVSRETEEVEFGTCELCSFTSTATFETFIFEKEDGTRVEVRGWEWDWGDINQVYIDNFIRFAEYVASLTLRDTLDLDYQWLSEIVYLYDKKYNKEEY